MLFRQRPLPLRSAHLSLTRICACLSFAALSALSATLPARAGIWYVTVTGPATTTATHNATPSTNSLPVSGGFSVTANYSISTGAGQGPGQPVSASASVQCPLHVAVAWQPNGSLASDPEPATVRLTESGSAAWSASGSNGTTAYTTGSGSASVAGLAPGTVQYSTTSFNRLDHQIQAQATSTCSPPAGQTGSVGVGASFTYSVQVSSVGASLTVDQDQQISAPAATTRFSATVSNASGFTVDSVKISVDGTPTTATVNPNNPNNYYIDWPQSGGNPSEHSVTATAQIHDSVGAISLNSLDAPNRQYNTSGMGRAADDIIADVKPQTIKFSGNITLNQDAVTPVPTPEFTWTAASGANPATSSPVAYVQGEKPGFTLVLASSAGAALTGSATLGYGLKLTASPNTTNPATNQADPALTLYDNTTGSPFMPTPCGASTTIAATTGLNSWVAPYSLSFTALNVYVEFTQVPTPFWRQIGGSSFSTTLYAVLATPTAPMATPWVPVLDMACNWAKRTSDATSATTAVAKGMFHAITYNAITTHVVWPKPYADGVETFMPLSFLSAGQGDCRDFSDFLVCSSNAIGAKNLSSQRSNTVTNILANQSSFETNSFFLAPYIAAQVPAATGWSYHQWSVVDNVYDACIGPNSTPLVNLPLSTYFPTLVDKTQPYSWNPQKAFTPTLSN